MPAQFESLASVALTPEFAYFVAAPASGKLSFKRVARESKAVATVAASGFADTNALIAGSTRIYVSLAGTLWSAAAISGEGFRPENLEVDEISAGGTFLYFTQQDTVYRRREGEPDIERVADMHGEDVLLAGTEEGVFVGSTKPTTDDSTEYEIVFIDQAFTRTTPHRGSGRLLSLVARNEYAYFLVEHGEERELCATSLYEGTRRVLAADASDLIALTPGDGLVFASFERTYEQGIRLYGTALPTEEWHTRAPVRGLASDPLGELWFFDTLAYALVRVDPFAGRRPPWLE